jgi:hypothetical protein
MVCCWKTIPPNASFAGGERVHVGIATFDSSIQFYSIAPGQAGASMMVVPEVDHPFCPQPTSVIVPLAQSRGLVRL